jgi:hypothetical protein
VENQIESHEELFDVGIVEILILVGSARVLKVAGGLCSVALWCCAMPAPTAGLVSRGNLQSLCSPVWVTGFRESFVPIGRPSVDSTEGALGQGGRCRSTS